MGLADSGFVDIANTIIEQKELLLNYGMNLYSRHGRSDGKIATISEQAHLTTI